LTPIAAELAGGVHATRDEGGDPRAFCESLAAALLARGVEIIYGTEVVSWLLERRQVRGVADARGTRFQADRVLLAAASYSTPLARKVGLNLPIRPAKGYSLTLERGLSGTAPFTPVMDPALHMAVVPVGEDRIRVAGTAEFAGYDTSLRAARIANLTGLLQRLYPNFAAQVDPARIIPWVGLRGMSADGVPLIGETAIGGLYLNAGHGPVGWTLAAGSGRLIADQILGTNPDIDPAPYHPARFGEPQISLSAAP
jgi:D-amino-acid dehydrogenase